MITNRAPGCHDVSIFFGKDSGLDTDCPEVFRYVEADARFVTQTDKHWFEFNIHSGSTS
jgi:hypothetical protein